MNITKGSQFLDHLDTEIEHVLEQRRREGWTTWALVGAVATLAWLLLDRLESASFSWSNILMILLALYFLQVSGGLVYGALWPKSARKRSSRFRYLDEETALSTILWLGYTIFLAFIAVRFSENLGWVKTSIGLGFLVIVTIFCVLLLWVRFFRIPLAASEPPLSFGIKIGVCVFAVLGLFLAFAYGSQIQAAALEDFRISVLLLAIGILSARLARTMRESPTGESLIAIRRDLAFGRIQLRAAMNQADIVLAGLRVSDVLRDDVTQFLDVASKVNAGLHRALTKLETTEANLKSQVGPVTGNEALEFKASLVSCEDEMANALKNLDEVFNKLHKIEDRMFWIGSETAESKKAITEIREKVNAAHDDVLDKALECTSKVLELRDRLPGESKSE